ncbi:formylglycine-generating enzyme family protein [Hoeflea sp.]|uniref:formylglycine-generating enzyme family protein n=1 Tax=Hoeflea sp. TaxID=1940281 RepID=UPI003B01D9C0
MYKVRDPRGNSSSSQQQQTPKRPPLNNIRLVHPKSKQQASKAFAPKFKWEDDTDSALDIPDFLLKDPNTPNENRNGGRRIKQALVFAAAFLLLAISSVGIFTDYLTADVGLMSRDASAPRATSPTVQQEAATETIVTPSIFDEVRVSQAQIVAPDPAPPQPAEPAPEPSVTKPATNAAPASERAPMPAMVTIEQGQYLVPKPEINRNDFQLESVSLDRFRIATSEVTREQWQACAADAGCSTEGFPEQYFGQSKLSLPITSITTEQILGFIDWINSKRETNEPPFRLPSDAEWIVAARGGESGHRNFAWGQDFDPAMIRATDILIPVEHGEPVNGLYGMADNAAERVTGCWIKELSNGECFRSLGIILGPLPGNIDDQTAGLAHRIGRSNNTPYQNIGFRLAQ